ncbi:CHAP domain-containing protein [Sphingomonas montanisoli]|uniref:Protein with peptidoglycan-binding domain protein n=1 Tax=Sphingomonas montanisoli TaxID=2606412 RepID=A0A5D9CB69_9SPHN|nr:CHAP domain-containing protein [Sphingomonas montanisoli]TZG28606.1 protein with peptidoglycan-binding domain protein [Sphingomonas montanisoli]
MLNSSNCSDVRLAKELLIRAPFGKGKSAGAKLLQEYLWVNGIKPTIDGDWGPTTQHALNAFCAAKGVKPVATADQAMMDLLAQPLLRAVAAISPQADLPASIVKYAKQHLAEHPIEINGANSGPWVRLYMAGNEGAQWLWCAGFVTYITAYCSGLHGVENPVPRTFGCDALAKKAKADGRFRQKGTLQPVPPGSVFLLPSKVNAADWVHTGIVLSDNGGTLLTAEGNTDANGTSNGFEANSRMRAARGLDIVLT